jgi:hypothetical protein
MSEYIRKLVVDYLLGTKKILSGKEKLDMWLVLGFGFGLYSFFKGFRVYREFRVIEDTPEMPIRSIPMGLVQVRGKTTGEPPLTSPLTQTPCFFCKVDIEKWHSTDSRGGGSWLHYKTDARGAEFYLEDATGKVLVDAQGAELDLPQADRREIDKFAAGLSLSAMPVDLDPALDSAVGASDYHLLAYVSKVAGTSGLASGRFRLTEYCIEPDQWYDVTGTCAENPRAADEHDRNLIQKGQNEPTFLISSKDKAGVEANLRWKAFVGVFGGAALSIFCLAFLLVRLGWL